VEFRPTIRHRFSLGQSFRHNGFSRRLPLRTFKTRERNDSMNVTASDFLTTQETEELGLPPYADGSALRSAELIEEFHKLRQALQRPVKFERRNYGRIPLPLLLRATPLDQTGQRLEELTTIVVGKDISPTGISFFHEQPLPHRRAIVSFEHPDVGTFTMEIDLSWCQFTGTGWYVSGGRLLRSLVPAA
jgi:hypothetical protein